MDDFEARAMTAVHFRRIDATRNMGMLHDLFKTAR
jgi:hypothetical protein